MSMGVTISIKPLLIHVATGGTYSRLKWSNLNLQYLRVLNTLANNYMYVYQHYIMNIYRKEQ